MNKEELQAELAAIQGYKQAHEAYLASGEVAKMPDIEVIPLRHQLYYMSCYENALLDRIAKL